MWGINLIRLPKAWVTESDLISVAPMPSYQPSFWTSWSSARMLALPSVTAMVRVAGHSRSDK